MPRAAGSKNKKLGMNLFGVPLKVFEQLRHGFHLERLFKMDSNSVLIY